MMRWTWFWKTLIIFKLQTWLGNAGLNFLCFFFCHVFSIEINYIMLSMCKSFNGMVLLVLILSCVGRSMVPMSLLLTMYTFVINAKKLFYHYYWCVLWKILRFFFPCWLTNSWILHFLIRCFYLFCHIIYACKYEFWNFELFDFTIHDKFEFFIF